MSDETKVPDSGQDINTPLDLHREEIQTLAFMKPDEREAVLAPLFGWLAFGEWEPPESGRLRSYFDKIVEKHTKAVAKHRRNTAEQVRKAELRWNKKRNPNAAALPMQYRGNTAAMPSPTTSPTPTTTTSPKNQKTESDTDSDILRGRTESKPESGLISAEEIARRVASTGGTQDPWTMPEDEVRYGNTSAAAILRLAFGKGGWRKAVDQAGEEAVRDLFLTFRAEIRAKEVPDNPAAAFTERLKRNLGVDFERGKEAVA